MTRIQRFTKLQTSKRSLFEYLLVRISSRPFAEQLTHTDCATQLMPREPTHPTLHQFPEINKQLLITADPATTMIYRASHAASD